MASKLVTCGCNGGCSLCGGSGTRVIKMAPPPPPPAKPNTKINPDEVRKPYKDD